MAAGGSPFCEHKKLRTSCPICKPASLHAEATTKVVPYVPQEERARVAEKRERLAQAQERGEVVAPKTPGPRGPGKPLLPLRKAKKRGITPDEADAVKPWWVKE